MLKSLAARAAFLGVLVISLLAGGFTAAGASAPEAKADGGCFSWNGIFIHASNCWGGYGYPGYGYPGYGYPGIGYGYGQYPYYPPPPPPPPPLPPPIPIGYGPYGPCGC
jgi:hypothetical protein